MYVDFFKYLKKKKTNGIYGFQLQLYFFTDVCGTS